MTAKTIIKKAENNFNAFQILIDDIISHTSTPEEAENEIGILKSSKLAVKMHQYNYKMLPHLSKLSFDEYIQVQNSVSALFEKFIKTCMEKILTKYLDEN